MKKEGGGIKEGAMGAVCGMGRKCFQQLHFAASSPRDLQTQFASKIFQVTPSFNTAYKFATL